MERKKMRTITVNPEAIEDLKEIVELWKQQKPYVGKLTQGLVTELLFKEELDRLKNKNEGEE
ncbi:hypothetical protein OP594_002648 [Enterococcus faecalis]|nr:hypothetical protein [Enterococcus faecalis]EKC6644989.1 hypothetical protein [Enterococcus faecalis]EKC6780259.1 hypothetical protein [Enterococcus faecalis]EKC6801394.1 hypothetical protein [Enterococcus faecalis]EKZ0051984.1 hypothetical protein [Enterococcus faecalis]